MMVLRVSLLSLLLVAAVTAQLSDDDKQELLDAHNNFRGAVVPPATNMLRMEWNDELAQVAQTYADMCIPAHNADRTSQATSFDTVGENLFIMNITSTLTAVVSSWNDQKDDYDYSSNSCSAVCGMYTQLVWATSMQLGCGINTACAGFDILVCNYGPAGNFVGQLPYQSGGQSCSECPDEFSGCVNNLCTVAVEPSAVIPLSTLPPAPTAAPEPEEPTAGSLSLHGCSLGLSLLLTSLLVALATFQ